ncbi:loganic acid O-methyltransferase-like [Tripterygium wilfordii]|uniref:loganic acid O-methyltransferase-like n=1 Tax=Tripterygium wilfordii TaxID=458696 RepID=UPI0018F844CF|nr:loganic acid O-methyltransferase-like [Tripterygium wilfordii]
MTPGGCTQHGDTHSSETNSASMDSKDFSIGVVGGHGPNSYFNNSMYQRRAGNEAMEIIDEVITKKLDIKSFCDSFTSRTIRLVDMGCAVGPNTFEAMQGLIEIIKTKYKTQCPNSPLIPQFQVFFNDQSTNDFNTLFASLPQEREYSVAGVPGSFYGRLFPDSSLHVVYTSYSLHWLSKAPQVLQDRNSPAWNKGRIHYTSAGEGVVSAYAAQFAQDLDAFLNARAKEVIGGGMMVIIICSVPDGIPYSQLYKGLMFNAMGSILLDMAKQGKVREEEVDAFNMPIYDCSLGEFAAIVERNGSFSIEAMGLRDPAPWLKVPVDIPEVVVHTRASCEGMLKKNFEIEIINELFDRLIQQLCKISDQVDSGSKGKKTQAYFVLQRK